MFTLRERLRAACDTCDVDASWQMRTKEAEASLFRVYHTGEGPAIAGPGSLGE